MTITVDESGEGFIDHPVTRMLARKVTELESAHRTADAALANAEQVVARLVNERDDLESALASERAKRVEAEPGEPVHGSMILEQADFDEAVNIERRRQKTIGYTNEHDDDHGVEHLLNWAYDYLKRGKILKAAALIRAARATFMRGESRALAAEATIEQVREWRALNPHGDMCGVWALSGAESDEGCDCWKAVLEGILAASPTAAFEAALAEARLGGLVAVLSAAHVPTGPVGIAPNTADADYMASAAVHLRQGHKIGGSGVTAAVARVLDVVAEELRTAERRAEHNGSEGAI